MREVKLAMYVSLDGVVESPAWTLVGSGKRLISDTAPTSLTLVDSRTARPGVVVNPSRLAAASD
jgi:hypothetical protein